MTHAVIKVYTNKKYPIFVKGNNEPLDIAELETTGGKGTFHKSYWLDDGLDRYQVPLRSPNTVLLYLLPVLYYYEVKDATKC